MRKSGLADRNSARDFFVVFLSFISYFSLRIAFRHAVSFCTELFESLQRDAVCTHPEITENNLSMLTVEGARPFGDTAFVSGTAYFRSNVTNSFNVTVINTNRLPKVDLIGVV